MEIEKEKDKKKKRGSEGKPENTQGHLSRK